MSIHHVQILRLPMCEVSDGKATTGGCVDQGILKEQSLKVLLLLLLRDEERRAVTY